MRLYTIPDVSFGMESELARTEAQFNPFVTDTRTSSLSARDFLIPLRGRYVSGGRAREKGSGEAGKYHQPRTGQVKFTSHPQNPPPSPLDPLPCSDHSTVQNVLGFFQDYVPQVV